jgi:hypothetical protein
MLTSSILLNIQEYAQYKGKTIPTAGTAENIMNTALGFAHADCFLSTFNNC